MPAPGYSSAALHRPSLRAYPAAAVILAVRDIASGEEVTLSYIGKLTAGQRRLLPLSLNAASRCPQP